MKKVNLACGNRFHSDWINLDFSPTDKEVKQANLLKRLPFLDNECDVVYSSHFLEHLSPRQGDTFLSEVYRILKQDGILRIVVPDLENICREYIKNLEKLDSFNQYKLEWITLELLDQMVRTKSGGEMGKKFLSLSSSEEANAKEYCCYIQERTGDIISNLQVGGGGEPHSFKKLRKFKNRFPSFLLSKYIQVVRLLLPKTLREEIINLTSIGEKHKWMYDRFSLKNKLHKNGFKKCSIQQFNTSQIKNFNSFFLDINEDGSPYKGCSSLYIECRK